MCFVYSGESEAIIECAEEIKTYYSEPGVAEIKAIDFLKRTCSIINKYITESKNIKKHNTFFEVYKSLITDTKQFYNIIVWL